MEWQHFPRRARDLACPRPQASPQGMNHAEVRSIADRRRILYGLTESSFFSTWPRRLASDASQVLNWLLGRAEARPCFDCCRISVSPMEKHTFPRRARDLACPKPQASPQGMNIAEVGPITDRRRISYGLAEGSFFSAWPRRLASVISHAHHSHLE